MLKVAIVSLFLLSGVAQAACTAEQAPPAGKPDNFNINKHLWKFNEAGQATSNLATRSAIMARMFSPGRKYDLKHNPNYMSSQEFGNWFYGAAAAQMCFSKTEALTAAAVVQQWQNYTNTNHPNAGDITKLASAISHAAKTSEGDNLDDAAPIIGGHSYSTDVYNEDRNSKSNSNSCDENDSSDSSSRGGGEGGNSFGGYGYGGGWGHGFFFGAGGCWGSCGRRGSVTITELPL